MKTWPRLAFLLGTMCSGIILMGASAEPKGLFGCSPEVNIDKPATGENVPTNPVAVAFRAEATDLTPLDLNSMRAELRDNLNNLIDITQYIASNCDVLKRNCTFGGDVNIPDGTYKLTVKVCNTAAGCTTKDVTFVVGFSVPDNWRDMVDIFVRTWNLLKCACQQPAPGPIRFPRLASLYPECECTPDGNDTDCDGKRNDVEGCDNCPSWPNSNQEDKDKDGAGDWCDNCAELFNPDQADIDKDGKGDVCDDDKDGDSIPDATDNCPAVGNLDQADFDGDGEGDVCDPDADGDGVVDTADNCLFAANPGQEDSDGDGIGDACESDLDNDGDGLSNFHEIAIGTDPNNPDTDGDYVWDGDEVKWGTDPRNPITSGTGDDCTNLGGTVSGGSGFVFPAPPPKCLVGDCTDADGDGICDAAQGAQSGNLKHPVWIVQSNWDMESHQENNELTLNNGTEAKLEETFKMFLELEHGVIANLEARKVPSLVSPSGRSDLNYSDLMVGMVTKTASPGKVKNWSATHVWGQSSYTDKGSCSTFNDQVVDVPLDIVLNVTDKDIKYKDTVDWDGSVFLYDYFGQNHEVKAWEAFYNHPLPELGMPQHSTDCVREITATCTSDSSGCKQDPCESWYSQHAPGGVRFSAGHNIFFVWGFFVYPSDSDEALKRYFGPPPAQNCDMPFKYSNSIPLFGFQNLDSFPFADTTNMRFCDGKGGVLDPAKNYKTQTTDKWFTAVKIAKFAGDPARDQHTYKVAYSWANPGTFAISAQSTLVTGNAAGHISDDVKTFMGEKVRWSVDPNIDGAKCNNPGGVEIAWTPAGTDCRTGVGAESVVRFTGLPPKNDDFGDRFMWFDLPGTPYPVTLGKQHFQVFFPKDERNHPNPGIDSAPNWYYYWKQTMANCSDVHVYEGIEGGRECGLTESGFYVPSVVPGSPSRIFHICEWAAGTSRHTGHHGIDRFAEACAHEKEHMDNFIKWWGDTGYNRDVEKTPPSGRDLDEDMVPDTLESSLGLVFGEKCSCAECSLMEADQRDDEHCLAYQIEKSWSPCSVDHEDWSYTGHQWGNVPTYCR